jgi:hypothetical protein
MKSSWIAAAVLSVTAWPGSKAFAVCWQQLPADGKPIQQAQAASAPARLEDSIYAVTVKPPVAAATTDTTKPTGTVETVKPKGSYMLVELTKPLKAKKLKVGDKISAEVVQDVVAHGKVIIPVETKLIGHVTEVSLRDSGQPESRLGIVFERILLKHHDISFEGVVQAVAPPVIRRSLVDAPSQMLPPSLSGVGSRGAVPTTRGASSGGGNQGGSGGSASLSAITTQAPVTMKASTSPHVDTSVASVEAGSNGKSMSIGMPQGVTGLKGLSLSTEPSPSTPGPVIVSNTENVKLDSGTQILLHVLRVEIPANVKSTPAK